MTIEFGYFDDERREYVITRPDTPRAVDQLPRARSVFRPVSNTAGGYSFYRDARLRRLTRYRLQQRAGRLRRPLPLPAGRRQRRLLVALLAAHAARELDALRVPPRPVVHDDRVGAGGIAAQTLYFVPRGENLEVWRAARHQRPGEHAELSLFSSVEFCLWDAQDDSDQLPAQLSTGEVEVADGVIYHKTEYRERRDHFAYFACSEPLAGLRHPARGVPRPYRAGFTSRSAVERGELVQLDRARLGAASAPTTCGSPSSRARRREVIFLLGYRENPRDDKFDPPGSASINKQACQAGASSTGCDPQTVREGFADLRAYWDEPARRPRTWTPRTPTANRMVNIWNAYQCMVTFNMSRSVSSFETGISAAAWAFATRARTCSAAVQLVPDRARERILDLASTQFASGGAYHQYQPLTKTRQRRDRLRLQRRPALAGPRRLPPTSRKPATPPSSTSASRSTTRREATLYGTCSGPSSYTLDRHRPARPAAHRPRRLERLPEPQLLLRHPGRVLPDHGQPAGRRRRVGLHRRPVHARRARSSPRIARAHRPRTRRRTPTGPTRRRWPP